MAFTLQPPASGEAISMRGGKLNVPDNPIIPFIEGDGTGPDIWRASVRVLDAAVEQAYGGTRKIAWYEVYAGEKANEMYGEAIWLPQDTLDAMERYIVGIKGPLTTPVGGGIRSLNVALRQELDLYVCLRPVRWFQGVPSPVRYPEKVDMVIFRENTEDIYAGIEWAAGTPEAARVMEFLKAEFPKMFDKIRFGTPERVTDWRGRTVGMTTDMDLFAPPVEVGIGLKPVSMQGSERLIAAAIEYAIATNRKSVTLVHKGNIMKFTEGAFRDWGYGLAKEAYGGEDLDGGPWQTVTKDGHSITIKDVIADAFLQQILTRPAEYSVIATLNLNGDYLSDALAAQVGGIGIAPGANINYSTGHAIFEATHGTAPKYAGQDKVNPSSVILSGEMMFRHLGWNEAADLLIQSMEKTITQKRVTYDFHRLMEGATLLKTSEFGDALIENMG